jgi:TfoX/Sxy family transcriptional regulator of competence genes
MAYNEELAHRIRAALGKRKAVGEIKMFGGLCFTLNGNMACGVMGDAMMVRIGTDQYDAALKLKHAKPMDFTGREIKGMVYVTTEGCRTTAQVKPWVERALSFVESLPPKKSKKLKKKAK